MNRLSMVDEQLIVIELTSEDGSPETVWARKLSKNTAQIDNLPLATGYKYKDIVEFEPETNRAIGIIQDGGYAPTHFVRYKGSFSRHRATWEAKGYVVEGMTEGIMAVTRRHKRNLRNSKSGYVTTRSPFETPSPQKF